MNTLSDEKINSDNNDEFSLHEHIKFMKFKYMQEQREIAKQNAKEKKLYEKHIMKKRYNEIIKLFGHIPKSSYKGPITPTDEKYGNNTHGIRYSNLGPGPENKMHRSDTEEDLHFSTDDPDFFDDEPFNVKPIEEQRDILKELHDLFGFSGDIEKLS